MCPDFESFRERFQPRFVESFRRNIDASAGFSYPFAATPLFLPRARFERLVEITNSIGRLLASPAYHASAAQLPWFLPRGQVGMHDVIGCVDFHVGEKGHKIIEVNAGPPGYGGFPELLEREFLTAFELEDQPRSNQGFERTLVDAVTESGLYAAIAVAANPTGVSRYFRFHYQYLASIFRKFGVRAEVVYADQLDAGGAAGALWDGVRYDRVFNTAIPRIWELEPETFRPFTRLFTDHPDLFLPNPYLWRLGDKRLLIVCHRLGEDPMGLGNADIGNIGEAALETYCLADFASPNDVLERFEGPENLVLKPFDNYDTRGVFLKPTAAQLETVWREERGQYIAQRYFEPGAMPWLTADGTVERYRYCVRMGLLQGRFAGIRATAFADAGSLQSVSLGQLAPVFVV